MPRAKGGFKTRRRRKKVLAKAKGYYSGRSRLFRTATEAVDKAMQYSYRDRKVKKREFRSLWITRISAAVRALGMNYSQFINNLKSINSDLDRKALAELAYSDPESFSQLVQVVKKSKAS